MAQIPKLIMSLSLLIILKGVFSTTFTFVNKCDYTVWPGILGSPSLGSTGFELAKGTSQSFQAPTGWSGRFWGRTGCNFDASGQGSCTTADCGSGQVECNGAGATPPATLAEFTLGSGSQDFYDVSLVDGYNIQMLVEVSGGGSGPCESTGCIEDLNTRCPAELKVEGGSACNSACTAFATPEYCCKGEFNSPTACSPSVYSQIFKTACPRSYSYAYDDKTSTFTCTDADYIMTFCPNRPSSKTTRDSSEGSGSGSGSGSETESTTLSDGWLANLATGESSRAYSFGAVGFVIAAISVTFTFTQFL